MLPHEHLVVAIVPVIAFVLLRDRRVPSLALLAVVAFGSQVPDLIDKPLAHQLHLLPNGRVGAHSLPVAVPIWIVALTYAWKTQRVRLGIGFVWAYASHLIADFYKGFLRTGSIPDELLWPFVASPWTHASPHWAGVGDVYLHLWTAFSVFVLGLAGVLLVRDLRRNLRENS